MRVLLVVSVLLFLPASTCCMVWDTEDRGSGTCRHSNRSGTDNIRPVTS